MSVRLIQPYPSHECGLPVPAGEKVPCPVPVYHVRYRYPHHSVASGYDCLCNHIGETIRLSRGLYLLGETALRIPAKVIAKHGGHFEYSRHDFVMEIEALRHFLKHRQSVYHFVYA